MNKEVECKYCGAKYDNYFEYEKDTFVSSDGWTWETFHNCQKDKGIEIHGYKV